MTIHDRHMPPHAVNKILCFQYLNAKPINTALQVDQNLQSVGLEDYTALRLLSGEWIISQKL